MVAASLSTFPNWFVTYIFCICTNTIISGTMLVPLTQCQPVMCCDRKSRAAYAQSFALWQQATIEFTCHDHSIIACSRHLYLWCCSFTHIPFVVNHTINGTPPERLQQWHMSVRQCWLWSENSFQFIALCLTLTTTSATTELLRALLKTLIGSWADLSSSSGYGSYSWQNIHLWLRLLLRRKMQSPAGVHSGTPST